MKIPNILTIGRILVAPILIVVFYFPGELSDWLGRSHCLAMGVSPRWLHQPVAVCAWRHCVHRWRCVVLYAKTKAFTRDIWLSRNLARVHCGRRHLAVCWRWRAYFARRLTPSETIVAGIKNARPWKDTSSQCFVVTGACHARMR